MFYDTSDQNYSSTSNICAPVHCRRHLGNFSSARRRSKRDWGGGAVEQVRHTRVLRRRQSNTWLPCHLRRAMRAFGNLERSGNQQDLRLCSHGNRSSKISTIRGVCESNGSGLLFLLINDQSNISTTPFAFSRWAVAAHASGRTEVCPAHCRSSSACCPARSGLSGHLLEVGAAGGF